jgi:hypothetical protein
LKKLILCAGFAAAVCLPAASAWAHHSFAMFDNAKKIDVKGTVKDLQWTNPHVWLDMVVMENGKPATYGFEGGAVAVLKKFGWNKDMVKPGDIVTLTAHPFKDGRPGGSIDFVTLADGRKIGGGDGIPGAVVVGAK